MNETNFDLAIDCVERTLRRSGANGCGPVMLRSAHDAEISRLNSLLQEAIEALEPFANADADDEHLAWARLGINSEDLRRARSLLQRNKTDG